MKIYNTLYNKWLTLFMDKAQLVRQLEECRTNTERMNTELISAAARLNGLEDELMLANYHIVELQEEYEVNPPKVKTTEITVANGAVFSPSASRELVFDLWREATKKLQEFTKDPNDQVKFEVGVTMDPPGFYFTSASDLRYILEKLWNYWSPDESSPFRWCTDKAIMCAGRILSTPGWNEMCLGTCIGKTSAITGQFAATDHAFCWAVTSDGKAWIIDPSWQPILIEWDDPRWVIYSMMGY